jgi:glycosyltransferase 2 family protein
LKDHLRIFKIIVAIGLLAFLFIKIDIVKTLSFFSNLHLLSIIAIFLVTFWLIFVSVFKWQIFLKSFDLTHPFCRLYQYYIIGYFFSNFLPSNIGGDIVRFSLTTKGKETYTSSFVAVFMERFTGIIATLFFVSISIPLAFWYFQYIENIFLILFPVAGIFSLLSAFFFVKPKHFNRNITEKRFIKKILEKIEEILSLIHSFRDKKQVVFKAMILSIIFNLLTIINVYVVSYALDIPVSFFALFIFVPLILIISSIPLSINAIGIAEGAYVFCLGIVGLSAPEALSIALLMRAKTLVVSLLGGLLFISYNRHKNFEYITHIKTSSNHRMP